MARRRKYGRSLARRYGHAVMDTVNSEAAKIRKFATENSLVTAGAVGAAGAVLASTMGMGPAAVTGLVTGIAIERVMKK